MIPQRPALERRILTTLGATPARIPVLLGGCGSGRTSLLLRVRELLGEGGSHYIDVERAASTPEGFYAAVTAESPYGVPGSHDAIDGARPQTARRAFDQLQQFFLHATPRAQQAAPPTFLVDELLELRTFESFPGLRGILRDVIETLTRSECHFVVTSRYVNRAHRLLRNAPERFEVIHVPPLSAPDISDTLRAHEVGRDDAERADLGRMIHALTDGRPTYVRSLAEALHAMDGASSGDPVSALASQLAVNAPLALMCRFSYELRLHRARGYGALKAILLVLSEEEPLTLTEIAHRLGRTPGSTKDYLTWLEDVDLVTVQQKRYAFSDPLLRLWVRLHCQPMPPSEADLSREVQEYAVSRLPYMEPPIPDGESDETAAVAEPSTDRRWSMIEID